MELLGYEGELLLVNITREELLLIHNALRECIEGPDLGDSRDEFHARIGCWPEEAAALMDQIQSVLRDP